MTTASAPPLAGIRVLELAGLAPGPFAGLLLADYGASVLRVDRAHPRAHALSSPGSPPAALPPRTPDNLTRHKSSIALDLKSAAARTLLLSLIPHTDVLIDPYRPGVLEKLGLGPAILRARNPRLIVARMTGFRRDGKYKDMAGHDINYIAVAGVLAQLGRAADKPYAPGNLLGDFAGGGAMCVLGILLALLARARTGAGQVVEANMVDGAAYVASFVRLARATPMWDRPRGENVLDGGCPWYDTYETKDGKFMSVGCLEPQFFAAFLRGLGLTERALTGPREDRRTWAHMRDLFERVFKGKTRKEWEEVFDGTDACVAPVLEQGELESEGWDQRPPVTLVDTPGFALQEGSDGRAPAVGQGKGVEGSGWSAKGLRPGVGGEDILKEWCGWQRGRDFEVEGGGLVKVSGGQSKL